MKISRKQIQQALRQQIQPGKAAVLGRFFKTGPGQYGEGDKFLGVMVPDIRRVAKSYYQAPLPVVAALLQSPWHEERLAGALILVYVYERGDQAQCQTIYDFYLRQRQGINNWDLVDLSADKIVGAWCFQTGETQILQTLAQSQRLWDRRIAMLASFYFIKQGDSRLTYQLAERFLSDQHDLMHKAVGWMLREAGKRVSEAELEAYLERRATQMPRTMLRYAIERLPDARRQYYLHKRDI